jgi:hypothetical protein
MVDEPDRGYTTASQLQTPKADPVTALLADREKTHGDFSAHARITQELKRAFYGHLVAKLSDVQAESVDMILHKLGRIAAGDPNFPDHWQDIQGYARLVSERLK